MVNRIQTLSDLVWIAEYQSDNGFYYREIVKERSKEIHPSPIDLDGKKYYFFRYLPRKKNENGDLEPYYPWM